MQNSGLVQNLHITKVKRQRKKDRGKMMIKKIAWGITGAGHFLAECLELMLKHENIDVYLSGAAEEVIGMYNLKEKLLNSGLPVYKDRQASSPAVGRFYTGKYGLLIIAPATSNTVAKFVGGISDTLVTNIFAHAGKNQIPVIVLPCDSAQEVQSMSPAGLVRVYPREIDLENVQKLQQMKKVTIVSNAEELAEWLKYYL
jgi:flavoprotein